MSQKKASQNDEKIARELSALDRLMEQAGDEGWEEVEKAPKRPGRPRTEHKDLDKVSLRLPEKYQKKLDLVPVERGAGSKVRFLLDYYFAERERDQRQWEYFNQVLQKCGALWKERTDHQQAQKLLSGLRELNYLQKILGYTSLELGERLGGKDLALWEKLQRVETGGV